MNINISFSLRAWDEYLIWQAEDKNSLRKINTLLKDIARNGPLEGIGRPEALKGELAGKLLQRVLNNYAQKNHIAPNLAVDGAAGPKTCVAAELRIEKRGSCRCYASCTAKNGRSCMRGLSRITLRRRPPALQSRYLKRCLTV